VSRWDGFATFEHPARGLRVAADFGGTDADPVPLAVIYRPARKDLVDLTAEELRWLAEHVAPTALPRMEARP